SIWNRCTVTLPVIGFDEGVPEKRSIVARLNTSKDPIPRFQTIFVDEDPDNPNPQDGIGGMFYF
ncbi:MAG TPA: hypothetical protein VGO47_06875, partial [Chlamydiales bacterium]|nr:hypothetical protein [Chlamydiales bacterium]